MAQPPVGILGIAAKHQHEAAAGPRRAPQGADEAHSVRRGQLQPLVGMLDAGGLDRGEAPAREDHPVLLPPQGADDGQPGADEDGCDGDRQRQHGLDSRSGSAATSAISHWRRLPDGPIGGPLPAADQVPGTRLRRRQLEWLVSRPARRSAAATKSGTRATPLPSMAASSASR